MDIFFIVDLVLVLILAFSVLNGYMRGFILTAASLAGIVIGWVVGRGVAGAFSAKFDAKFITPIISDALPASAETIPEVVSDTAHSAVSSVTGFISYGILFIIAATLSYALVLGIGKVADRLFDLPVLSLLNKIGGVLAGFALGCCVLFVIGLAFTAGAKVLSDFLLMPEIYDYVEKTRVLRFIIEHNPLSPNA